MSCKLSEELWVQSFDVDPDATTLTDVVIDGTNWVDMRKYDSLMVVAMGSVLNGDGIDQFKICSNNDTSGGGTDVDIVTHAIGSVPDAVGDMLVLEVSKDEVVALDEDGRYVCALVAMNDATDEAVVTYIGRVKTGASGSTADAVA